MVNDSNVQAVLDKYQIRSVQGFLKYKTTTDRQDVSMLGWLTHAQDEAMDLTIYLERLKREAALIITKDKSLRNLSERDYNELKAAGFLWEFYPNATGSWFNDCTDSYKKDWISKYE